MLLAVDSANNWQQCHHITSMRNCKWFSTLLWSRCFYNHGHALDVSNVYWIITKFTQFLPSNATMFSLFSLFCSSYCPTPFTIVFMAEGWCKFPNTLQPNLATKINKLIILLNNSFDWIHKQEWDTVKPGEHSAIVSINPKPIRVRRIISMF